MAAGVTWWIDAVLLHRVANGTDHATRLAAVLTYVGVDGWYTLARAMGITALVFGYASVLSGLVASSSPGRASESLGSLHRQAGVVTIALVAGHAALPFASVFEPYGGIRTSFLPFAQPVSWGIHAASWESLGILAFYLLLLIGPTYYLAGRHPRGWVRIHRMAAAVYALSVAHAFLLGTDFIVRGPARVLLLAAQVPLLLLLARRLALFPSLATPSRLRRPAWRWTGAAVSAAGSAALAAFAVLVATGRYSPGLRL